MCLNTRFKSTRGGCRRKGRRWRRWHKVGARSHWRVIKGSGRGGEVAERVIRGGGLKLDRCKRGCRREESHQRRWLDVQESLEVSQNRWLAEGNGGQRWWLAAVGLCYMDSSECIKVPMLDTQHFRIRVPDIYPTFVAWRSPRKHIQWLEFIIELRIKLLKYARKIYIYGWPSPRCPYFIAKHVFKRTLPNITSSFILVFMN